MLASIITPTYNSEQFIEETIRAIQAQTLKDWEFLITDDGSDDDTISIIQRFAAKDPRIKLFRLEKNSGAAVARNNSIKEASGRFIAFCDSDDLWTPNKLEKQIAFMQEKDIAFSFAPYHVVNEQGSKIGFSPTRAKVGYKDILITCDIGTLTAVYDTSKLGKVYMPLIRKSQDYGLWLRILKLIDYAYSYPAPLGYYRIRPHSISNNKIKAMQYVWKIYRDVEKLSLTYSLWLMFVYSLYGIKKYGKIKLKNLFTK